MDPVNLAGRSKDYALYLPSIQYHSSSAVSSPDVALRKKKLPAGLKAADFNWLDPNNSFWHYHAGLASAAHFKGKNTRNSICERDPSTIIVGDSGGYQIGTGALDDTKLWRGKKYGAAEIIDLWTNSPIKHELLQWLDLNCTLGMSIDMPLWAIARPTSPFSKLTKQQLLDLSRDNLQFMDRYRNRKDGCRILNVLQAFSEKSLKEDGGAESEASEEEWYQTVKSFSFDGWSLAGDVGVDGGLYRTLRRILRLRDDKLLEPPRSWLHLLKLSPCRWSPLVTQIQRCLRQHVNPEFVISFDSSTPYKIAGKRVQYVSLPVFGAKIADWRLGKHIFPTGYTAATRFAKTPLIGPTNHHLKEQLLSPIASKLKLGDMLRTEPKHPARADKFAQEVIINHNVYTYVLAGIMANEIAFGKNTIIPHPIREAMDLIKDLFFTEQWSTQLSRNRSLLAGIKP